MKNLTIDIVLYPKRIRVVVISGVNDEGQTIPLSGIRRNYAKNWVGSINRDNLAGQNTCLVTGASPNFNPITMQGIPSTETPVDDSLYLVNTITKSDGSTVVTPTTSEQIEDILNEWWDE